MGDGAIRERRALQERLDEKNAIIITKLSNTKSLVKFLDTGYEAPYYNINIERGEFNDRLIPSVCGVGFGVMRGQASQPSHKCWKNMLSRCYSYEKVEKYKTYKDCTVCEDWLDFRVFSSWYEETYPRTEKLNYELDKDMKIKGNKVYSPTTCIWIPKYLNQYINDLKGASSITGVKGVSPVYKTGEGIIEGVFEIRCSDGKGRRAYLGTCSDPEEGFKVYKRYKEGRLKLLAEEYLAEGKITSEVYKTVTNFKV